MRVQIDGGLHQRGGETLDFFVEIHQVRSHDTVEDAPKLGFVGHGEIHQMELRLEALADDTAGFRQN